MRAAQLVLMTLLLPIAVAGSTLAAWPAWLLWPALVFAVLLVLTVALGWLARARRPIALLMPIAAMVVSAIAVAIASPGATSWVLWPLLLSVLVAIAASLAEIVRDRARPHA